jgi:hypothetical protein
VKPRQLLFWQRKFVDHYSLFLRWVDVCRFSVTLLHVYLCSSGGQQRLLRLTIWFMPVSKMAVRIEITLGTVLAIAVMGMAVSALGVLVATRTISNTGNVKVVGVGVYRDSGCTNPVSSIDWGALEPGVTTEVKIYVKNEGGVAVVLGMTIDNWNPASASSYMTLSWNRENYVLNSGSVVLAVLTLSVSSGVSEITNFSFDIIITGTAQT